MTLAIVSCQQRKHLRKDNTFADPALKTLRRYLIYHLE